MASRELSDQSTLSVVIPAYNEEEAIGSIIEQTLAAKSAITGKGGVASVEVIVVNDGSSDRTAAIAGSYQQIRLISYEKNRGYGAAIKLGFAEASGDLLSFLDADGTCDPRFFGDLCQALATDNADIAIGARMGPTSRMPPLRRLGNRIYAAIISVWGGTRITDSASGMRVIRRDALRRLYPLPDGMHFTPAMSSLAVFDPRLKIVEVPMTYEERAGESKLHVVKDGLRFLRIIVDTALTYKPLRLFGVVGALCLLLGVGYGAMPLAYYLSNYRIEEWMIYRLVAVSVALVAGTTLLMVGVLGQKIVSLIHGNFEPARGAYGWVHRLLLHRAMLLGSLAVLAGVALNWRALVQYATTGHVTSHWIYQLTGGLLVTLGVEFYACGTLARVVDILTARAQFAQQNRANESFLSFDEYADDYDRALAAGIAVSGEDKNYFARGRVEWLKHCLPSPGAAPRVLDFGCGTGSAAPFLLQVLGASLVVGVDLSAKSIEVAGRTYGSERARFLTTADYQPAGDIDLAFCNGVFHHIPLDQRAESAALVYRSLRPGGLFSFWENNPWNPGTRLVMSRIPFDRDAIMLSSLTARRLLRAAGFEVVRTDFLFVFPGFLRGLRWMEPSLSRFPIGAQYQVLARVPG